MDEFQNITEEWRPIPEWAFYEASNFGRIRSHHSMNPRVLKPKINRQGYLTVGLVLGPLCRQQWRFIHRLVAAAFIGPLPVGLQVDHKDGNKMNNSATNLEYVSQSENILRSFRLGRVPKRGEQIRNAKLTEDIVRKIRTSPLTCKAIAEMTGMNLWAIHDARSGRTWKHIK